MHRANWCSRNTKARSRICSASCSLISRSRRFSWITSGFVRNAENNSRLFRSFRWAYISTDAKRIRLHNESVPTRAQNARVSESQRSSAANRFVASTINSQGAYRFTVWTNRFIPFPAFPIGTLLHGQPRFFVSYLTLPWSFSTGKDLLAGRFHQ